MLLYGIRNTRNDVEDFKFQLLLVLGVICRSVMLRLKLPLALKAAAKLQF